MTNNGQTFSLLPYLGTGRGHFHLKTSLISGDSAALEKTPFPFLTITDSDPLTRLIEARIMSDAGSDIERVFLLVQRDRYLIAKDELWPLNNRDIEDAWQKAFTFHSSELSNNLFISLAGQIDAQGAPVQISSLFYCKTRELFFHPPCPKCGMPLQQCRDEEILSKEGLQSWSGSLKRYLYCPSCASAGKLDFYVYELDPSDPQTLRDRTALIRKFKLLVEGSRSAEHFPCVGCPNYKDCYGPEQRVLSRIVPFSFYPFHMFIFKALTLNAADFLSLVSGASYTELEEELVKKGLYGRSSCLKSIRQDSQMTAPRLFESGSRRFLEILYLKLTFLAEVFQDISSGSEGIKHPDLRLSLESIWVKLPEHGSRLPFMWDFRVKFMDIFRQQTDKTSTAGLASANALFFLGLVWFHALLVNRRQEFSSVYQTLMEFINRSSADSSFSFDNHIQEGPTSVFQASNIFRDPEGKTVDNDTLILWVKALNAGWSVLNAGYRADAGFSPDNLLQQLDSLRDEVKGSLFSQVPADEGPPSRDEEKAISGILRNIYDKWSSSQKVEEEALTETVIMSPETADKKIPAAPPGPSRPVPPDKQEDFMTETVVLSPQRMKDTLKPSEKAPPKKPDAVPAETVIISANDTPGELRTPGEQPMAETGTEEQKKKKEQDFLAETIILKPGELKGKGKK